MPKRVAAMLAWAAVGSLFAYGAPYALSSFGLALLS